MVTSSIGGTAARTDVVLLGSTGSIGTQALDVIRANPDRLRVVALSAGGGSIELLAEQVVEFDVRVVGIARGEADALLRAVEARRAQVSASDPSRRHVSSAPIEILTGPEASTLIAGAHPDAVVLNGMSGGVGLGPTLAALRAGSTLALANKESLVVGGHLVKDATVRDGQVVPVDSEHSAIAQSLLSGVHEKGLTAPVVTGRSEVATLVLTASGGPFRGKTRADLADVTPDQALAHPTWDMGPVVTLNSSTLVNKGLELIEAHLLFDIDPRDIRTTVHPQSIVHSMVTWRDGATIAQASPPDMHLPIALGMTWSERLTDVETPLSWDAAQAWTFEPVDDDTFPAINLARHAVAASATHPAVYNAANEVFVQAFMDRRIGYLDIVDLLVRVVEGHDGIADPTLDDIMGVQEWAVARAEELVGSAR